MELIAVITRLIYQLSQTPTFVFSVVFLYGNGVPVMFNSVCGLISHAPCGEVKPSYSALKMTTREWLDVICQDSLKPYGRLMFTQYPIKTTLCWDFQHVGRYIYHTFVGPRDAAVLIRWPTSSTWANRKTQETFRNMLEIDFIETYRLCGIKI